MMHRPNASERMQPEGSRVLSHEILREIGRVFARMSSMLDWLKGDPWTRAYRRLREPKTEGELTLNEGAIERALRASPIPVETFRIDVAAYQDFRKRVDYETHYADYYPENIWEKSLEHFVTSTLLDLQPKDVYIDIASQNGVAAGICERLCDVIAYQQDIDFPLGVHGRQIGGDAAAIPLGDGIADAMALHCSFEHFEGDSDSGFIAEAGRLLKPGARCVIAPLYLCHVYACLTDPMLSADARVEFEPDMRIHAMRTWHNRHGRFYDVPHLLKRVWEKRGPLSMKVLLVENWGDVHPSCYLRYVLLLEK